MKIIKLKIDNFRGIKSSEIKLSNHTVIVGDNNTGKSSILEAIDLVLGPERLSKYPVIDEHDFYAGQYTSNSDGDAVVIGVEILITDLNDDQLTKFKYHIEWLDKKTQELLDGPPPERTDSEDVAPALRVCFKGNYDAEDDDFVGKTFFCSPATDEGVLSEFHKSDKRECGFLLLRTLRTGSRALSLEKGTLLDIILRLREVRPKMWEDVLTSLRSVSVADKPELGLSDILNDVQDAIRSFVPADWAEDPRLRVSTLTRVELRRILTVFMDTGSQDAAGNKYSAPFQHQGTGTINTLVLSLLVMIAELKKNVIFAMEEPEIAIPPHTQKRIINNVIAKSSQAIFTSHSPYVMEEFEPEQILVVRRDSGLLTGFSASYPPAVKRKKYREEFRRRFCEALLARRILITEGRTEFDVFPTASRRLSDRAPSKYSTFEALGIAVINAETDSQVEPLAKFFQGLGKVVYAVFDKQTEETGEKIREMVDHSFECPEKGIEKLIANQSAEIAVRRFLEGLVANDTWPRHMDSDKPTASTSEEDARKTLFKLLKGAKGEGMAADFVAQCKPAEMAPFIKDTLIEIKASVEGNSDDERAE